MQYKEWETEWNGKQFKGLDFKAMQVLDLVEYGSSAPDGSEFDIEDDAGDEL